MYMLYDSSAMSFSKYVLMYIYVTMCYHMRQNTNVVIVNTVSDHMAFNASIASRRVSGCCSVVVPMTRRGLSRLAWTIHPSLNSPCLYHSRVDYPFEPGLST